MLFDVVTDEFFSFRPLSQPPDPIASAMPGAPCRDSWRLGVPWHSPAFQAHDDTDQRGLTCVCHFRRSAHL